MSDWLGEGLRDLRDRSLYRQLRFMDGPQGAVVLLKDRELINFSSNDYLGFADEPSLVAAAIEAVRRWGVGAGASRLVSGSLGPHLQLEEAIAKWKETEAALTFSSGYAAAVGTIGALIRRGDIAIVDKLCHASLLDGVRLSEATMRVFPHNHVATLERHLKWAKKKHPAARVLIITESVFSMDGDMAPVREIVALKQRHGAILMLDEAHAVGVIGPKGRGLAADQGVAEQVEVQMGTLSKALGVSGGYICGSRDLVDWLINRARSFIFSTAPPPAIAATAAVAVDLLQSEEGKRRRESLKRNIRMLAEELRLPESDGGSNQSAIFPWIVGAEIAALDLARDLFEAGFFVPAIRYPTVGKGKARLRITVTASHEAEQIRRLGETLRRTKADD